MHSYWPIGRALRAVVVALWIVLVGVQVAASEDGPAVGRSAVTPEELGVTLGYEGPVTAPGVFGEPGANVQLGGTNEPTVAVNPLNASNIAAAAGGFTLRVSTDGGTNFSAGTNSVVPSGYNRCGDSSVAFDSQGRLFWTYLGCRTDNGNPDVFIGQANSTTGAILPGYPVNVTAAAGFPASTAAASNDKAVFVEVSGWFSALWV